jgi:hypothetical protein
MTTVKTTKPPPRLPPIRIGLEVGLPTIAICDTHSWIQLPILSLEQGLRFVRTLGYDVPADCRARIAAGQIVTLEEASSKLEHVPNCSQGEAVCEE